MDPPAPPVPPPPDKGQEKGQEGATSWGEGYTIFRCFLFFNWWFMGIAAHSILEEFMGFLGQLEQPQHDELISSLWMNMGMGQYL